METKNELIEQRDVAVAALGAILESIDDESLSLSETVDQVEALATQALDDILGSDSDDEDDDEEGAVSEDEEALMDA
jgi:hypothetical protein